MLVSPLRLALALALAGAASGEGAPPRGMGFGLAATARTLLEPLYSRLARAPSLRANCAFAAPPAKWRAATEARVGADAHWESFITATWGDFHGKFCRFDPASCDLLVQTHLLRSYHLHGRGSETFLRQDNKIFFEDERGTVCRGPWDVTKADCSTERGIIHPRVGEGESGTTFLVTPGPARATAWAVHRITLSDPLLNPGVVPLGKGHEGQGYMVEMIMSHGPHVRLSVGYVYDDVNGKLQHVTFNREDNRGWPSSYWGDGASMAAIEPAAIGKQLGVAAESKGFGHQIEIPVKPSSEPSLKQLGLSAVPWQGHLASLEQDNTAAYQLPDGLVMLVPRAIPFGQEWAAAYVWKPPDAEVVHTLETRYAMDGAFDCFRHVEFAL